MPECEVCGKRLIDDNLCLRHKIANKHRFVSMITFSANAVMLTVAAFLFFAGTSMYWGGAETPKAPLYLTAVGFWIMASSLLFLKHADKNDGLGTQIEHLWGELTLLGIVFSLPSVFLGVFLAIVSLLIWHTARLIIVTARVLLYGRRKSKSGGDGA